MSEYNYKYSRIAQLKNDAIENLKTVDRSSLSVSSDFLQWKGGEKKDIS